jgi:hypothetical protein
VAYSATIPTPKKRFVIALRAMHSLRFADFLLFWYGNPWISVISERMVEVRLLSLGIASVPFLYVHAHLSILSQMKP